MKEVKICIILLLLFGIKQLSAQQSRSYTTVLKYLDGQTSEKFRMIPTCIDGNGDILIAGISGVTDKNITVRKLNPQGALIWEYTFDSDNHGDDWASDMDTDDAGNVYVCGSVVEKNPDKQEGLLIKISPTGSLLWQKEKASLSQNTGGFFPEHGQFYHFTKIVLNKQQNKLAIAGNSSSSPYIDHILDANLQQNQDSIYTVGSYEVYKFDGNMIKASTMWMAGLNDKKSYSTDVNISAGTFFETVAKLGRIFFLLNF